MSSTTAAAVSTTASAAFALTTTFTPTPSCTQSFWTMLPPQSAYYVYLNYPDPLPQSKHAECYPSEFLSSYYEQQTALTPLPAIAPLICPKHYVSISVANAPDGYVACCPSGMQGIATSAQAPFSRPAFNGTCYSAIATPLLVTKYGESSIVATSTWSAPADAQAFAIPIEGYAFVANTAAATVTRSAIATPVSTTSSSATPSPAKSSSNAGAIAGGVVGGIAGLALIVLAIWYFFVRNRNRNHASAGRTPELPADAYSQRTELAEKDDNKPWVRSEPHSPMTHHELDGTDNAIPVELDANRNSMYKHDRSHV